MLAAAGPRLIKIWTPVTKGFAPKNRRGMVV
jgi:hypothetical protein